MRHRLSDDFWECAGDHQDTDGFGVCCVFYGGDYDESSGECWIDHEAKLEEANTRPQRSPEKACADAAAQPARSVAQLTQAT